MGLFSSSSSEPTSSGTTSSNENAVEISGTPGLSNTPEIIARDGDGSATKVIPAKAGRNKEYKNLFNRLDVSSSGEVTFDDFKEALKELEHPISGNEQLVESVFESFDHNKDHKITFEEFKSYLAITDNQIEKGFNVIDSDHDGRFSREDFKEYFYNRLHLHPTDQDVDQLFYQMDSHHDGFVTYDEFREFLILMPRLNGSRIRTAFNYIVEELDISSDGDVTLINQFLNGFGFFLAGGLSGVVSRTCTAPFDRIKVFLIARTDLTSTVLHSRREIANQIAKGTVRTKMQQARKALHLLSMSYEATEALEHPKKVRSPIIQAARTIWKQGGFKAFYVGNGLNVVKVFPESAMKFGSFEAAKRFFARIEGVDDTAKLSKGSNYLAGGFGGVCAQFTVYPIDTLKFRLQCSNLDSNLKGNALLFHTAKTMYKDGGLRMFYRGIFVGVSGIFPYAALDLGTFTSIKNWLVKRESLKYGVKEEDIKLPNYMVLSLGAFSGSFGATVVYPINLLRTRLQAQGTYAHPYTYDGFNDVLRKTIAREGYGGLFKGLTPNLAKVAPAVSISYFMYENLKIMFGLDNQVRG